VVVQAAQPVGPELRGNGASDPAEHQVAHAVGAVADQLEHEPVLEVLAEHDDADPGFRGADLDRGAQAVVGETRRHSDVGDHDVGPVGAGQPEQIGGVGGAGDRQARPLEHPHYSLADERLVLPDDDRQGTGHDHDTSGPTRREGQLTDAGGATSSGECVTGGVR
jgi:hypothetical protein